MNKVLLILLVTIFSHSAMSSEFCENAFAHTRHVITKLYYPRVTKALRRSDAMVTFKGMIGYLWVANKYFNKDMRKTYITVRTILGREKFQQLKWKFFGETTVEYDMVWEVLINSETGKVNPDYIGQDKLKEFAELHYKGDILRAYTRADEALDGKEFVALDWKHPKNSSLTVVGRVTIALRHSDAMVTFKGMIGYLRMANEYFNKDMRKTYITVRTILGREKFQQLKWKFFGETTVEYDMVWEVLINSETGKVNPDYIGQDKLKEFAKLHYKGDILRAYTRADEALDGKEFVALDWKHPKNSSNTFVPFAKKMLTRARYPGLTIELTHVDAIKTFKGMSSYRSLSNIEFKGDMQKTYFIVLRILGEEKFMQLGWRLFNGTVLEYNTLRSLFIDPESGKVRPEYIGHDKLKKFALIAYNGNILKAYMRVEEALDPAEFAVLGREKPLNPPTPPPGGTNAF